MPDTNNRDSYVISVKYFPDFLPDACFFFRQTDKTRKKTDKNRQSICMNEISACPYFRLPTPMTLSFPFFYHSQPFLAPALGAAHAMLVSSHSKTMPSSLVPPKLCIPFVDMLLTVNKLALTALALTVTLAEHLGVNETLTKLLSLPSTSAPTPSLQIF